MSRKEVPRAGLLKAALAGGAAGAHRRRRLARQRRHQPLLGPIPADRTARGGPSPQRPAADPAPRGTEGVEPQRDLIIRRRPEGRANERAWPSGSVR